jgi:hypothetical protein
VEGDSLDSTDCGNIGRRIVMVVVDTVIEPRICFQPVSSSLVSSKHVYLRAGKKEIVEMAN